MSLSKLEDLFVNKKSYEKLLDDWRELTDEEKIARIEEMTE